MTGPTPADPANRSGGAGDAPDTAREVYGLVVAYARQETLEPLKALGRYVAYGLAGGLLLGTGVVFLAIGGLRALQTETGTTFTGNWSWAPYGIVLVGLLLAAAVTWSLRNRRKEHR